ncbi:hypothetical protein MMC13_007462 [Lambiella insularis]|nr:hypothetical protein [Lambiella insularis]
MRSVTFWACSLSASYYVLGWLDDEEEEVEANAQHGTSSSHGPMQQIESHAEGDESEGVEGEREIEHIVPDTLPDDAWFIPLGWARQCPPTFYKGSDPEWQSFIDFAQDRKRNAFVRHELAGLVGEFVGHIRQFQKFLGAPIQTRKYWLDVDFPDGPPPEYERAGLEITDDYIAWTVRPVSPINISRLQGALWPQATFSSFCASTQALWQLQVAKVKDYLNIKEESGSKRPRFPPGFMNVSQLPQKKDDDSSHPALAAPEERPSPSSALPVASGRANILWPLPGISKPSPEMATATTAFKNNLAQHWRYASAPAPRGTFMVSGLVELRGPKGTCVMDVQAAYHPQESRWVAIAIGVRRIQKRKQGPKGGP